MCCKNIESNSNKNYQIDNLEDFTHPEVNPKPSISPDGMDRNPIKPSIAELIDESKYLVERADRLVAIHRKIRLNQQKQSRDSTNN